MRNFANRVIDWQRQHGRHGLPWQKTRDAYRIWLSEIMLQQTQVSTVIPYYRRFLARFPDVRSLARASEQQVLGLWSGLGYYARARNLHAAAREVVARWHGEFPARSAVLEGLPGIGRSTAAAIAVFSRGERAAILDGNVRRVFARAFGIEGDPAAAGTLERFWSLAEQMLPRSGIESYTQGLMDLGAGICVRRNPRCMDCPLRTGCVAYRDSRTEELPSARRSSASPERRVHWLVLRHGSRVLLERRPGRGIWGGLLAPPEGSGFRRVHRDEFAFSDPAANWERLPRIRHSFTHFRLLVQPWLCETDREPAPASLRYRWVRLDRLGGVPLPTPVRRLLDRLRAREPAAEISSRRARRGSGSSVPPPAVHRRR